MLRQQKRLHLYANTNRSIDMEKEAHAINVKYELPLSHYNKIHRIYREFLSSEIYYAREMIIRLPASLKAFLYS